MIQKQAVDRLIAELQQLSANYAEHEAFEAKYALMMKAKAEHETVTRELAQYRRELSDLQLEYQDKRQQLGQLMADIVRRGGELQRINGDSRSRADCRKCRLRQDGRRHVGACCHLDAPPSPFGLVNCQR
jgi:chromosome segregation ATPase